VKTFLAIVGALALLIVGSIAVLFFIGLQKAGPLLQEAHDYADDAIPAVATKWDGAALSSRAAPELADLLKNGALETIMAEGSRLLGEMTAYENAACQITNYQFNTDSGELVLAACTARATHARPVISSLSSNVTTNGNCLDFSSPQKMLNPVRCRSSF